MASPTVGDGPLATPAPALAAAMPDPEAAFASELNRPMLQTLCKRLGMRANRTNREMAVDIGLLTSVSRRVRVLGLRAGLSRENRVYADFVSFCNL